MNKKYIFLWSVISLSISLSAAQQQKSPRDNHKDVYQTDARAKQLQKNTFLFALDTEKLTEQPSRIASIYLVTQKEKEIDIYSEIRTGNYKKIDPEMGDLIREHEGNLMKHFIVFLDAIDPALVAKFLTTRQRVKSIIEEHPTVKS